MVISALLLCRPRLCLLRDRAGHGQDLSTQAAGSELPIPARAVAGWATAVAGSATVGARRCTVGATVGEAAAGLGRVVAATETLLVFYWDSDNTDFRCSFRSHTPIEQVAPVVATAPRAQPERQTPAMQHPLGLGWSLARLRKEMARNAVVA